MLKLDRPLCIFDLEATGLDVANDRIVSIAAVKIFIDGHRGEVTQKIRPGIPIPPEASKIHGITDADVATAPTFSDIARFLHECLADSDLAGFNLLNFDVPLLWEEFHRTGIEWDLTGVRIIDVGNLFKKKEPRTLAAAVMFYCGREHMDAHSADADAHATADVLHGQLARYPDLAAMNLDQLAEFSRLEEFPRIDLAGKFIRDAEGEPVYNFGKNKGTRVCDDPGLCRWMLNRDFSANTLMHARAILEAIYKSQSPDAAEIF